MRDWQEEDDERFPTIPPDVLQANFSGWARLVWSPKQEAILASRPNAAVQLGEVRRRCWTVAFYPLKAHGGRDDAYLVRLPNGVCQLV